MARLLGDFIVVQKNLVSKGIDKMSCFLQKVKMRLCIFNKRTWGTLSIMPKNVRKKTRL